MICYQSRCALSKYTLSSCFQLCVIPELFGEGTTRPGIIKTNAAIISSALAAGLVESPYLHFELIYGAKWLLWSGLVRVCVWELGGERREWRECLLKIALSDYETAYETPPAASVWITLIVWFLCVFFFPKQKFKYKRSGECFCLVMEQFFSLSAAPWDTGFGFPILFLMWFLFSHCSGSGLCWGWPLHLHGQHCALLALVKT